MEFFVTECITGERTDYKWHANVPLKEKVVRKIEYWKKLKTQEDLPISVAMIVLDSVSHAHMLRSLPKTLLMLNKMNFIEFKGHHILGEPTMPNAIPMLLGALSAKEFFKTKTSWTEQWDKYPFIWKKFAALNYVTLLAEDMEGTFNYGEQRGFNEAPTDYYPRPFYSAHRESSLKDKQSDFCFGNHTLPDFVLNYHFRFLKKLHPTPSFSINWIAQPQHDIMEALERLDDPLFNFFRKLASSPSILENTLILFTSDHGFWMHGKYPHTHEGLLERRLPMLYLRIPDRLSNRRPEFVTFAKNNAYRLTSHHDTYATLSHMAQLASEMIKKRKKVSPYSLTDFRFSLFTPIPLTRTCQFQALIPPSVCVCNLPPPPENSDSMETPIQVQLPPAGQGAFPLSL